MVLVEAKNQPSGLTKESFTAVVGDQFQTNLDKLRQTLNDNSAAALGMSPEDRARMLEALNADSLNVEIQIHTTPETDLGHRDHPSSSILEHIETSVKDVNPTSPIKVVHVPMDPKITAKALKEVQARDAIGKPSVRLKQLAGDRASASSPAHKRAESMMLAEQGFTQGAVRRAKGGKFVDGAGVEFEVLMPGERGGKPEPSTVARQVMDRIRTATQKGTLDKTRIVLDLSHLNAAERLEVLQILKDNPKAVDASQSILIHDRAGNSMSVFDPKDIP